MIQGRTVLSVGDNSGVKIIRCIKILGGYKKRFGFVGTLLYGSILKLRKKRSKKNVLKKGDLVFAIITTTKRFKKLDGQWVFFYSNSVAIVDKNRKPFATRIFGSLCSDLRIMQCFKLMSLSTRVF
jgi:large subunit ribosomal protein L14